MLVVGISGVSCGGKSLSASTVRKNLQSCGLTVKTIGIDSYCRPEQQLTYIPHLSNWNWDCPEAIDFEKLLRHVKEELERNESDDAVLIVEGINLFASSELTNLCRLRFFLTLDYEECKRRRDKRTDYVPPDLPGFFEEIVWPEYEKQKEFVSNEVKHVTFLSGASDPESIRDVISLAIKKITGLGKKTDTELIWMKHGPLSLLDASRFVTHPTSGAISVFIGTTRNNSDGKEVVKLEYETYDQMAVSQMDSLCSSLRLKWPDVAKICIFHRLGEVPVAEASVIIAVSSPHRSSAMESTQFAIEELKRNVPIWKKEVYAEGGASWKQNSECAWKHCDSLP